MSLFKLPQFSESNLKGIENDFFRKLVRMIADNDSHDFLTISESTKDLTCHCHRYGDLVL